MSLPGNLAGRQVLASGYHAPDCGRIEAFERALITLDAAGEITGFALPGAPGHVAPPGTPELPGVLLPGFVDLHVHAPQYPQLGSALDVPLEDWLLRYTFPLEARYADLEFAETVYRALVADLIASGTTTALYFATVHVPATQLLADICLELGQRALVGKVAMDHPEATPDYYRDASAEAAVAGSRAVINHIRAHPGNAAGRVQPVITPRFIPSCSDEALAGLGQLAQDCGCRVQSHVSESDWAHGHVLARHGMSDAESLARFGLLTPHSVLAHGNFLSDSDMGLLMRHQTGVAHCPLSNAYFAGAVFPLRAALEKGLAVGLGSDISGGPAGSIWESARMAIAASRLLESGVDPDLPPETRSRHKGARIDSATAFHLATAGGARALGLNVGHFAPGMRFDAMLVAPPALTLPNMPAEVRLEQILYRTERAQIRQVWVDGQALCPQKPGPQA